MINDSAPVIARRKASLQKKLQPGTIVSWTVVAHPPAGFPAEPRRIALIALEDGTQVMGYVRGKDELSIGQKVHPRMQLMRTAENGLRTYDIAYEPVVTSAVREEFPGYILALTGPSGVGKTTVSVLLTTAIADRTQKVPILTTREAKAGDSDEYQYVSIEEFTEMKDKGELASYTEIPAKSEKRWYGYRKADVEQIWESGKIPVVVTEMHLLQSLSATYGRRSILSCGLLPPGKSKRAMLSALLHRLRARGRDSEESIQDRIKNAEKDLKFFNDREDLFDHMIVNEDANSVVSMLTKKVLQLAVGN